MQFLVTGKLIDPPAAPPHQEIAALKATFELLSKWSSGANPKVKAVLPHADERATTLLVDVRNAEDLVELQTQLPGFRLSTWSAHPVTDPQTVLKALVAMERNLAGG